LRFEGTIRPDSIAGTMTIAWATFPMTLRRPATADVLYRREPVSWRNGEVQLAGTLYLPAGRPPHPVMVFTHGSGASTRHEYAADADALARAGIAALIYDKRGAGESSGANWRMATFRELAADAAAGVRMLRTRPDIDARKVGLFGLSQGTWLIGMVAEADPDVGFLVFVSGSGVPVWEQEVYRTGALMRAAGFSDDEIAEARAFKTRAFTVARTGLGWPALDSMRTALRARYPAWFDDYADEFGSLTSARFWWLAAYHYDPTPALEGLTMPVLGLFGEDDLSFPIPVVVDRMRAALARAGNRDVTLTVVPGAEHQLMVAQEFRGRRLRRIITPRYLPTLVGWLRGRLLSHPH
jgi:pimeloyl-ACP methyl ester carboxylesterase